MTAQEAYQFTLSLVNEEITGNVPEAVWESHFNKNQTSHITHLIGDPRQYKAGQPVPAVHNAVTRQVAARLKGLRVPITRQATNGFVNWGIPADMMADIPVYLAATSYQHNNCDTPIDVYQRVALELVDDDAWAERTTSRMRPITIKNPVYRFVDVDRIQIAPMSINYVEMAYYRTPPNVIVSSNTDITWWQNQDVIEIIGRTLGTLGVNLDSNQLIAYSDKVAMEGNQI